MWGTADEGLERNIFVFLFVAVLSKLCVKWSLYCHKLAEKEERKVKEESQRGKLVVMNTWWFFSKSGCRAVHLTSNHDYNFYEGFKISQPCWVKVDWLADLPIELELKKCFFPKRLFTENKVQSNHCTSCGQHLKQSSSSHRRSDYGIQVGEITRPGGDKTSRALEAIEGKEEITGEITRLVWGAYQQRLPPVIL